MSSRNRLNIAVEQGLLAPGSIRAALGNLGTSLADDLFAAEAEFTPLPNERLSEEELRLQLTETFSVALAMYGKHLTIDVPAIADFEDEGYDLYSLFNVYNSMRESGLEPEFVLAPELTKQQAHRLFTQLADDSTIPNQRLARGLRDVGMQIPYCFDAYEVSDEQWAVLSTISYGETAITVGEVDWTLTVMPTCVTPEHLGQTYKQLEDENILVPNLSQLLSLHCQRIYSGKRMIDEEVPHENAKNGYYSIVSADFESDFVPSVFFSNNEGRLKVKMIRSDSAADNIGTRAIRWQLV